jgi:hypothetical protein
MRKPENESGVIDRSVIRKSNNAFNFNYRPNLLINQQRMNPNQSFGVQEISTPSYFD